MAAVQRKPVRLKVWGQRDWDVDRARQDATVEAAERDWVIVETVELRGAPNPIPRKDRDAISQSKKFNRAWAFYPAQNEGDGAPNNGTQGNGAPA